jgi:hypothetical protein
MAFIAPIFTAVSSFFTGAFGSQLLRAVAGIGLNLLGSALAGKPKTPGMKFTSASPLSPRRIVVGRARVEGTIVYEDGTDKKNRTLNMIVALCEGPITSIDAIYFDDKLVPVQSDGSIDSGTFKNKATIRRFLGAVDQQASGSAIAELEGKWTSDHRLQGIAYLYAKLYWAKKEKVYTSSGKPNITAVVKGQAIHDPRTGLTAWTDNAALWVRHYLTLPKVDGGAGFLASELNEASFIAAANICDELVALEGGGSEKRYTANGVLVLDDANGPKNQIPSLLTACAGRLVYSEGKWTLLAGAWRAPTFTVDETVLRGPISGQFRQSLSGQFNAVRGSYIRADKRYVPTDYTPVVASAFEAEDANERVFLDWPLEWTTSHAAARRLARIELYRAREPEVLELPCTLAAYECLPGDTIAVNWPRWGYSNKTFEVLTWGWDPYQSESGVEVVGIKLTVRAVSAAIYDETASPEDLIEDSPATDLPDWSEVETPSGLEVTEELFSAKDSAGLTTLVTLDWPEDEDTFVNEYEGQYRAVGASQWISIPSVTVPPMQILDVAAGAYEFQLRSVNSLGTVSEWATITQEIAGLSAPPQTPTGFRFDALNGMLVLRWDQSVDLDVRAGGAVQIRHSQLPVGVANWTDGTIANSNLPGAATHVALAGIPGTYMVRFIDSTGNLSSGFASIAVAQSFIDNLSTLANIIEDPAFTGAKTQCVVTGGLLQLSANATAGTYVFANAAAFAAARAARVSVDMTAQAFLPNDDIDNWQDIDTIMDWDGEAQADAWVEMRFSEAAGTPVWSAWQAVRMSDVFAKEIQFRAGLTALSANDNIGISRLRIKIEEKA